MKTASYSVALQLLAPSSSSAKQPSYYTLAFHCGHYSFQLYIFPTGNRCELHLSAYLSLRAWFAARPKPPAAPGTASTGASASTLASGTDTASSAAAAQSKRTRAAASAVTQDQGPHVSFTMTVTSANGHMLASKTTVHTFTGFEDDWGWQQLCPLAELHARASEGEAHLSVSIHDLQPGPETPLQLSAMAVVPGSGLPSRLQAFHGSDSFVDCVLRTETRAFQCHRLVLAAASPVFEACFTNGLLESHNRDVTIRDADPDALQLLLQHMYGQQLHVPLPLLLLLMALADRYGLQALCQELQEWLDSRALSCQALVALLPQAKALACHAAVATLAEGVLDQVADFVGDEQQLLGSWQQDDVALVLQHAALVKEPLAAFKLLVAYLLQHQQQAQEDQALQQLAHSAGPTLSPQSAAPTTGSTPCQSSSRPELSTRQFNLLACHAWLELLPLIDCDSLTYAQRAEASRLAGVPSMETLKKLLLECDAAGCPGDNVATPHQTSTALEHTAGDGSCCLCPWSFCKRR